MAKKLSEMTDEERYGKVGAAIRRLDPEAYKNRPRTLEGNLNLLKELRQRKAEGSSTKDEDKESSSARDLRPARNPRYAANRPDRVEARNKRETERYLARNPQYREREPGLQAVDEELFSPGVKFAAAGAAGGAAAYGAKKLLDRFRNKRAVSKRERDLDERLAADMAGGYKRGGSVKSSASRRADGIAKKGKTRGKMV